MYASLKSIFSIPFSSSWCSAGIFRIITFFLRWILNNRYSISLSCQSMWFYNADPLSFDMSSNTLFLTWTIRTFNREKVNEHEKGTLTRLQKHVEFQCPFTVDTNNIENMIFVHNPLSWLIFHYQISITK